MVDAYIPERGDIVLLNFQPQAGKEQQGVRPAITISPKLYQQKVGLGLFCPITSKEKGYAFEVRLPSFLQTDGVILADHIKNIDFRARGAKFLERVDQEVLDEVIKKVMVLLR